ncbi:phospholipase D-like domain-containing protein [Microvirga sp. W0021]|uniref:Phospholipase D n=1 Tax=Hohaiivirga grylli TaxID=3133970 RepID=A0ABV0BG25_9HYPH
MANFFANYWPHIVFVLTIVCGVTAAIHAAMTKDDVRAAIGWVGIVLLSPLLGAVIYAIAGINRFRQKTTGRKHAATAIRHGFTPVHSVDIALLVGSQFASLKTLVDSVSVFPLTLGNRIKILNGGDETYPAMIDAIESAQKTIAIQSYIFDNDAIGKRIVEALAAAKKRGVEVRVLVDGIGIRYSRPRISRLLKAEGIPYALFNSGILGMRLPYANLRSHRKVMVVDGIVGLTGGMNIRQGFSSEFSPNHLFKDKHFQVSGPIVSQLLSSFMHDWQVTTNEELSISQWFTSIKSLETQLAEDTGLPARIVPSGPDQNLANTHRVLMGAITVAQKHIRICSPYFIPDQQLIGALAVAARRGIIVDIVIPSSNNLKLVDYAMTAQLDQVIHPGCRVWRASGDFDHSKLMTVDGAWSYVGSSNFDPRSLRLNFELDMEVYDRPIAQAIEAVIDDHIKNAIPETLQTLNNRSFVTRLRNRAIWLATPYL